MTSKTKSLMFELQGSRFKVQGSKFKVQSSRFKVQRQFKTQYASCFARCGLTQNSELITQNSKLHPILFQTKKSPALE